MSNNGQSAVILCVDDERSGLLMRKLLLESQGYKVLTAESGAEGLDLLLKQEVDLVLLDYMMPGVDGGTTARRMKEMKPATRILMLSAYLDVPAETLIHVDRYVIKGQAPTALLSAVAELLKHDSRSVHGPAA